MNITFEFADTFTVESRDQEVNVPVADLPTEILAKIFQYGLNSVIPDAANGAPRAAAIDAIGDKPKDQKAEAYEKKLTAWYKAPDNQPAVLAKTSEMMEKRLANFLKGSWSIRGAGQSRREKVLDNIVRAAAKSVLSADDWTKFDALSDEDQSAKVRSWYEGNKDAFDLATDERIIELDRKREEKKALQSAVKITL